MANFAEEVVLKKQGGQRQEEQIGKNEQTAVCLVTNKAVCQHSTMNSYFYSGYVKTIWVCFLKAACQHPLQLPLWFLEQRQSHSVRK